MFVPSIVVSNLIFAFTLLFTKSRNRITGFYYLRASLSFHSLCTAEFLRTFRWLDSKAVWKLRQFTTVELIWRIMRLTIRSSTHEHINMYIKRGIQKKESGVSTRRETGGRYTKYADAKKVERQSEDEICEISYEVQSVRHNVLWVLGSVPPYIPNPTDIREYRRSPSPSPAAHYFLSTIFSFSFSRSFSRVIISDNALLFFMISFWISAMESSHFLDCFCANFADSSNNCFCAL